MPKKSEKKRLELEQLQASLKTNVREKKPFENYLGFVKELNKKQIASGETGRGEAQRPLQAVSSLPNLNGRVLNSEQKLLKSPGSTKPDSSRNQRGGRLSHPGKALTAHKGTPHETANTLTLTPTEIEITCRGVKPTKTKLVCGEVFEVTLCDWG